MATQSQTPAVDLSGGLVPIQGQDSPASAQTGSSTPPVDLSGGLVPAAPSQERDIFSDPTPASPSSGTGERKGNADVFSDNGGVMGTVNRNAAKVLSAAGLPTSLSNIPDWFQHLTGTHPNSEPFWEPVKRAIQNPTQENIVGAVPFIGPASVSMSKDVQKGDYAGAASTLAGTLAAPKLAEGGGEIASKAGAKAVETAGKVTDAVAEKMYQSTLKPGPRSFTPEEVESMVRTGLDNQIPVSKAGIKKLDSLVSDLNSKIAADIKTGSDAGATVNKYKVASRLADTSNKFKSQVNPDADLAAVGKSGNEFLESQPTEIPASDAQALKQGTYRQLGDKAYGELSSAAKESQKALARGIKEELASQFPEIAGLNAQESKLLGLDDALETAVNRTRNHNILGLGTKIVSIGGGAAIGGEAGAAAGTGLAVMQEVLSHPAIQSRIAIGISRASKIPYPTALARVGAYVSALDTSSAQQTDNNQQNSFRAGTPSGDPGEWVSVQDGQGHQWQVHPSDLAEMQRRDPKIQLVQSN